MGRAKVHARLQAPVDGFMIQFNKNAFGLAPGATAVPLGTIAPGGSADASVPVALSAGQVAPGAAPNALQARRLAVQFALQAAAGALCLCMRGICPAYISLACCLTCEKLPSMNHDAAD